MYWDLSISHVVSTTTDYDLAAFNVNGSVVWLQPLMNAVIMDHVL